MLVDQNGAEICETVEILEYSKVQCLTKLNQEIPETQMSIKVGGKSYPCAAIDSNKCLYKQLESAANMPKVTGLELSETTIVYQGTSFFTEGYQANAEFMDIKADTVTIDSEA